MVLMTERVALTFGARLQHLSSADRCSQNEGLNSSLASSASATSFVDPKDYEVS
jgi:hypothetical protein